MSLDESYLEINRKTWNQRTALHLNSDFYDQKGFLSGKTSLKEIELELLGNVEGQKILHLQCHFGQDTISLARMGGHVTGVDFSDAAIDAAGKIATQAGQEVRFICTDLYTLPEVFEEQFDLIYTSYGTIGWLPDLDRWAAVIRQHLKPGGRFLLIEFHPVLWMFDDDQQEVTYSYFNEGPLAETETGTYADRKAETSQSYICWNHSLAEVVNSLMDHGLQLKTFREYDFSPYNIFRNGAEVEPGQYRPGHLLGKIPLVYAIEAILSR